MYVPADASGGTKQVPIGPGNALGERVVGLGLRPQPVNEPYRPTHMVTFRHPYNGQNVTVPLKLPDSTPRMEHRGNRIIYNYGSYTVEAHFLPDGAVETLYNSGFLRTMPQ